MILLVSCTILCCCPYDTAVSATFRIFLKVGKNSCFCIPGRASATCCTLQYIYSKISRGGKHPAKGGGGMPPAPPPPPKKTLALILCNLVLCCCPFPYTVRWSGHFLMVLNACQQILQYSCYLCPSNVIASVTE